MRQRMMALLLALTMALSLALPAGAAETQGTGVVVRPADVTVDTARLLGQTEVESSQPVELIVELSGQPALAEGGDSAAIGAEQAAFLTQVEQLWPGQTECLYRYSLTINAVALSAPEGLMDSLEALEGVTAVQRAAVFQTPDSAQIAETVTQTAPVGDMIGLESAWAQGYDGTGIVVAVIDTGLDVDHPAFADDLDQSTLGLDRAAVAAALDNLHASEQMEGLTVDDVYRSGKIPFAFNYADRSTRVSHTGDTASDHGTHVAGIVAADDGVNEAVTGVAPEAQLLVMKVFGASSGGTSEAILLAALEDSIALGADIINLSLGSTSGFSSGKMAYTKAIETAVESGIIVCAAAGNEYSSTYANNTGIDLGAIGNVDVGVVSEPSSLPGVLAVASANNAWLYADGFYLQQEGEEDRFIAAEDNGDEYGLRALTSLLDEPGHEDGRYEYVLVPGNGTAEDLASVDVAGKIALIRRGTIPFAEKSENAFQAGAVATIIYNHVAQSVIMDLSSVSEHNDLPCVLIAQRDGEALVEAAGEDGTGWLIISPEPALAEAGDGWLASDFSSWGALPDLALKPDLTGVGGNVYSTTDGGEYGIKSGTSMATPQMAGMAALMLQYLQESRGLTGLEAARMAQTLLMNTATQLTQTNGVAYSPRKQGAGLANVGRAVATPVRLSVSGSDLPKAELGDDRGYSGVYQFTFTATNESDEPRSYLASATMLTETATAGYLLQQARPLDARVTFNGGAASQSAGDQTQDAVMITVPAGGETVVTVTIRLSETERKTLRETFENGIYIEGFVCLEDMSGEDLDLSIPVLAFYGDWSKAPLFEQTTMAQFNAGDNADGHLLGNSPYPFQVLTGDDSYLGANPVATETQYIPARSNALNDSGGEGGVLQNIVFDLLRGARKLTVEVLGSNGQRLYSGRAEYVSKSCYDANYQTMAPVLWSDYDQDFSFDPTEYGLGDGSTFTIRITGEKDASGPYATEIMNIPVYVDGTAPEVLDVAVERTDGTCQLRVTAQDNFYTAGIYALSADGAQVLAAYPMEQQSRGGRATAVIEVTEVLPIAGGQFLLGVMDYAQNMTVYEVNVLRDGETTLLPTDVLYAYCADYDHQGWYSLDPADLSDPADAFLSYLGRVSAAEMVGDYLFAVGENDPDRLYALDTATFQPTLVCELGMPSMEGWVLDLAYRQEDGRLYILAAVSGGYRLYWADPMTGEAGELAVLNSALIGGFQGAYALTELPAGDLALIAATGQGTAMYALQPGDDLTVERIASLDVAAEGSTLSAVTDLSSGTVYFTCCDTVEDVSTLYTWTAADGLETVGQLPGVAFSALVRTGGVAVEFPADGAITGFALTYEEKHLGVGGSFQLPVLETYPWYVSDSGWQISYTSSDPAVAVVIREGVVTGKQVGQVEITATLSRTGEESVSAQCLVTVEPAAVLSGLIGGARWVTLEGAAMTATPAGLLHENATAAAYAVGAGPEGQDVIYVLDNGRWDERTGCQVYTLYTYDGESRQLLGQSELARNWSAPAEAMPAEGFQDLAYDPYTGYLVAAAGESLFSIDPQKCRFYAVSDVSARLDGASLLGLAFDSEGTGFYVASDGAVGHFANYLGSTTVLSPQAKIGLGGNTAGASALEYDELADTLWLGCGSRLYGFRLSGAQAQVVWSGSPGGEIDCLFTRHFPSGRVYKH